jgi:hypothetical protein
VSNLLRCEGNSGAGRSQCLTTVRTILFPNGRFRLSPLLRMEGRVIPCVEVGNGQLSPAHLGGWAEIHCALSGGARVPGNLEAGSYATYTPRNRCQR